MTVEETIKQIEYAIETSINLRDVLFCDNIVFAGERRRNLNNVILRLEEYLEILQNKKD